MKDFKSQYDCIYFSGEITEGPKQSWFGEYMAVYQALRKLSDYPNIRIEINTDHESLSKLFRIITTCSLKQFTNMGKMNGIPLLSAIRKLEQKRKFPLNIKWVKSHSGKFGNAIADELAGRYFHPREQLPLSQYFECPDVTSLHSCLTLTIFHNTLTQESIRSCLKTIHRLRDQKDSTTPSPLSSVFQFMPKAKNAVDIEKRLFQVTFEDLAIGTLPLSLVDCIQEIDKTVNPATYPSRENSAHIRDIVFQVCDNIQKDAAEYWKERCKITTNWEENNGITKDLKRKQTAPTDAVKPKRKRATNLTKSTKLECHADKLEKKPCKAG
jgi:ribonuclease HI